MEKVIANATTADALVERVLNLVEALTPDGVATRFRRYRGEGDGDFIAWCEANPESAFRRVQARHSGSVRVPEVSNGDFEERETTITIMIAYANDARAGRDQTRSRDQLIALDLDQLETSIGLYSRVNFQTPSPEAFFRDWSSTRITQTACTFLVVDVTYAFNRELRFAALTAALTDSTDPLTADGGAFSYSLAVTNTGSLAAGDVVAVVSLPAGVGFVSASGAGWTCTNSGQAVTCRRSSGESGAMPTITINCTAPTDASAGTVTATASVTASNVAEDATASQGTTLAAPLSLVVLFGQSNAAGRAAATDVTIRSGYADPYPGLTLKHRQDLTTDDPLIWQDYPTETLRPRTDSAVENFGPELSMGRLLDLVGPGDFAIVQTAIGGAGLNDHLRKTAVYPSIGDNAYKQTVDYIKAAEAELNASVAAFVWVQGETDALVEAADAAAYQANLTQFIADMRAEKPEWASVPFVFNKLNINNVGTWRTDVRNAQVAVAAADPTTKLLLTDDMALNGGQHFFADGYVLVGERFGYGVLEMLDYSQDVRMDGTSLIKRPANRLQWRKLIADNGLNWGLPHDSVSLQDLSGNIVGVHGNVRLVPANAPLYDRAIPGWSAHGAGTAEASTSRFRDGTTNLPNCNTTSWLVYAIVYLGSNPAATRCIMALGTGAGAMTVRAIAGATNPKIAISAGSNVNGTIEYSAAFPLVFKLDRTGLVTAVYTDKEKLLPAVGSPSGTNLDLGASSPSTAPDMACSDLTMWTGADAEKSDADIKAMLQANGWTVTGY